MKKKIKSEDSIRTSTALMYLFSLPIAFVVLAFILGMFVNDLILILGHFGIAILITIGIIKLYKIRRKKNKNIFLDPLFLFCYIYYIFIMSCSVFLDIVFITTIFIWCFFWPPKVYVLVYILV